MSAIANGVRERELSFLYAMEQLKASAPLANRSIHTHTFG
jgi:hypothetical protein